jgi:leucine dehydrogenase
MSWSADRVDSHRLLTDGASEQLHKVRDPETGLHAFIAIHNTIRGPAFGGCRMLRYASEAEAMTDACRLAEGMSLKNALAELPFGGGKAVILQPDHIADRGALFWAFGREVERLEGRYITAEDSGTTADDMRAVQSSTGYVSGIPREASFGGDPSRFTALGVFLSIEAAVRSILGRGNVKGVKVAVQGAGAVGSHLCAELVSAGARVWIADTDPAKTRLLAGRKGLAVEGVEAIARLDVDVFAPCALGGVLTESTILGLRAPIIAGAANNQLSTLEMGDLLHDRGIWYLPDFLVNAGGIIAVAHEYLGTGDFGEVLGEVTHIAGRVDRLIAEVRRTDEAPARVALKWAKALIRSSDP